MICESWLWGQSFFDCIVQYWLPKTLYHLYLKTGTGTIELYSSTVLLEQERISIENFGSSEDWAVGKARKKNHSEHSYFTLQMHKENDH